MRTAILVDGGYYRKRAASALGHKTAKERAEELYTYCNRHLKDKKYSIEYRDELYRIFYYDCAPISKKYFIHCIIKQSILQRATQKNGRKIFLMS